MKSFLAALALLAAPVALQAQSGVATRTWVSGVGDDVNPCSRTAPGKTFAGALAKTAPGGELNVLDPGNFGSVTIVHSFVIDGEGAPSFVLVTTAGTDGITINAGASDTVTLRQLRFAGKGVTSNAINIVSAGTVIIEDCEINGFGTGINFAPSAACKLLIKNTTISNCSGTAVVTAPAVASTVSVVNSHFSDCGVGLSVGAKTVAEARDTISVGHGGSGFITTAAGAVLTLTRCNAFDNNIGVQSSGGTITLNDNAVMSNVTSGLKYSAGANINSFGNNSVTGNNPDGSPSTFPLTKK